MYLFVRKIYFKIIKKTLLLGGSVERKDEDLLFLPWIINYTENT